jgi:hypothetical protein
MEMPLRTMSVAFSMGATLAAQAADQGGSAI